MAATLAEAHIEAQERLRAVAVTAMQNAWTELEGYDEEDVAPWLTVAVPLVLAVQRQSALLTAGYLARAIERPAIGVDLDRVTGAAIRNGTPTEVVYRRPFVQVWSALAERKPWEDAVEAARVRVGASAAMDVQNAMRHTLVEVGQREDLILGYRRVPDATACPFCRLIAGRRYLVSDLQPVHAHCGCGVDVITAANRGDFTGKSENDLSVTRDGVTAAVRTHGELGPLLVNAAHDFTALETFA